MHMDSVADLERGGGLTAGLWGWTSQVKGRFSGSILKHFDNIYLKKVGLKAVLYKFIFQLLHPVNSFILIQNIAPLTYYTSLVILS